MIQSMMQQGTVKVIRMENVVKNGGRVLIFFCIFFLKGGWSGKQGKELSFLF